MTDTERRELVRPGATIAYWVSGPERAPVVVLLHGLARTRFSPDGVLRTDRGYPFSTQFTPITGRVGYTWDIAPGVMLYSQYATAAGS